MVISKERSPEWLSDPFCATCTARIQTLRGTGDKSVTGHVLRQKIADMIEEQGKQNMYKITLTGYRDPDIWYELDHMDPYGNVVEITDHTKPAYDFEKLKNENKGNILGQYIESLSGYPADSLEYQALCEGVQALMETRRG